MKSEDNLNINEDLDVFEDDIHFGFDNSLRVMQNSTQSNAILITLIIVLIKSLFEVNKYLFKYSFENTFNFNSNLGSNLFIKKRKNTNRMKNYYKKHLI